MPDLTHESICTVAAWYIRKNSMREDEWRYTRLLHLHDELKAFVLFEPKECPIVSCYVDRDRWFSSRKFSDGAYAHSAFNGYG